MSEEPVAGLLLYEASARSSPDPAARPSLVGLVARLSIEEAVVGPSSREIVTGTPLSREAVAGSLSEAAVEPSETITKFLSGAVAKSSGETVVEPSSNVAANPSSEVTAGPSSGEAVVRPTLETVTGPSSEIAAKPS